MIGRLARRQCTIFNINGSNLSVTGRILHESPSIRGDAFYRPHMRASVASSLALTPRPSRPPRAHFVRTSCYRRGLFLLVAVMKADISLISSARDGPVFVSLAARCGTGAPRAHPPLGARERIAALLQLFGNIHAILLVSPIVVVVVTLSSSESFSRAARFTAFAPCRIDPMHHGTIAVAFNSFSWLGTVLFDATFIMDVVDFPFLEDLSALDSSLLDAFATWTGTLGSPSGEPSQSAVISASKSNPGRTRQMIASEISHCLSIVFSHAQLNLLHVPIADVRAASISGRPSVPSVSDLSLLNAGFFDHVLPIDVGRMQLSDG